MPVIRKDEIRGYYDETGKILCPEIFERQEDWSLDLTTDDIITTEDIERDEEKLWFCDETGVQL